MLTREGARDIREIKMFRPLHQGESSSSGSKSVVKSSQSCDILVCNECEYKFCSQCLMNRIKDLPIDVIKVILQKWFDSDDCAQNYRSELPFRVQSEWRVYYGQSRQFVPRSFAFILRTDWTWIDYFTMLQRVRIHRYIQVHAYASMINPCRNIWSQWFKLFMWKFLPRASFISNYNFKAFTSALIWEVQIAAQNGFAIEFEMIHDYSLVCIENKGPSPFSLAWSFSGIISLEENERPQSFYNFPFSCVFREHPPYWLDDSVPVDLITYDVEADVGRHNQQEWADEDGEPNRYNDSDNDSDHESNEGAEWSDHDHGWSDVDNDMDSDYYPDTD